MGAVEGPPISRGFSRGAFCRLAIRQTELKLLSSSQAHTTATALIHLDLLGFTHIEAPSTTFPNLLSQIPTQPFFVTNITRINLD